MSNSKTKLYCYVDETGQDTKVKGVKDENEALIRLADAISGLIREDYEGIDYAKRLLQLGILKRTLIPV